MAPSVLHRPIESAKKSGHSGAIQFALANISNGCREIDYACESLVIEAMDLRRPDYSAYERLVNVGRGYITG